MKDNNLLTPHVTDLLYQALETEKGGVQIYTTALRCAVNDELREEWQEYLEQTKEHVQVVTDVLKTLGLNPETETPGRKIVRHIGTSLSKSYGDGACEEATLPPRKLWPRSASRWLKRKTTSIGVLSARLPRAPRVRLGDVLKEAYDQVEPEEDEHLYHTQGWTRELWIEALGMPAVLPPPEEKQKVETAIEAAQAKKSRKKAAGSNKYRHSAKDRTSSIDSIQRSGMIRCQMAAD